MITGECFCGEVRYAIEGRLQNARACHCSRCRKAFSGASSAWAELAADAKFTWVSGEDKLTHHIGAEGWGIAFCRICGSKLCIVHDRVVKGVTLGGVNGDPGVQLSMHIFVGSRAPWDHIGGPAPQHEEWPVA